VRQLEVYKNHWRRGGIRDGVFLYLIHWTGLASEALCGQEVVHSSIVILYHSTSPNMTGIRAAVCTDFAQRAAQRRPVAAYISCSSFPCVPKASRAKRDSIKSLSFGMEQDSGRSLMLSFSQASSTIATGNAFFPTSISRVIRGSQITLAPRGSLSHWPAIALHPRRLKQGGVSIIDEDHKEVHARVSGRAAA